MSQESYEDRAVRLAESLTSLMEYNPYHDKGGRFTSKGKSAKAVAFRGTASKGSSKRLQQDRRATSGTSRKSSVNTSSSGSRGATSAMNAGQLRRAYSKASGQQKAALRREISARVKAGNRAKAGRLSGKSRAASAAEGKVKAMPAQKRAMQRAEGRAAANKHSAALAAQRSKGGAGRGKGRYAALTTKSLGAVLKSGSRGQKMAARKQVRQRIKSYKRAKAGRASGKARRK